MRVIAGSARHLKLKTIEGMGTRPTTDRIKETLFNMLSFYVEESRFLDLFSGSGGIGIEALSRGASQAVFVEQNRKAAACIEENLNHTHLREKAVVTVSYTHLTDIFKGLGVDYLIEGGQTMNPSTEDMLNAIEQVNAKNIFILPNNKNIILAAEQARDLTEDKKIIVLPTKTIPQGISAMIGYMPCLLYTSRCV